MDGDTLDPQVACPLSVRLIIEEEVPFRAEDFEAVARCLVSLGVDIRDVKLRLQYLCKVWDVRFRGEWWTLLQGLGAKERSDGLR